MKNVLVIETSPRKGDNSDRFYHAILQLGFNRRFSIWYPSMESII
jgi:hypothetical protein